MDCVCDRFWSYTCIASSAHCAYVSVQLYNFVSPWGVKLSCLHINVDEATFYLAP